MFRTIVPVDRKNTSDADWSAFEALDPWKSLSLNFNRRNLPHVEAANATYFVTFRTRSKRVLRATARDIVFDMIISHDGRTVALDALVVMPDHVHLIFRLTGIQQLGLIFQLIKGGSARRINQAYGTQGSIWMDERFDHVIRNTTEFEGKIEYIRQNAVKKRLVARPEDYRWLFVKI